MIKYDYTTHGVCSRVIHIALDDTATTIEGVSFEGGCEGNLKAIATLVRGQEVSRVRDLLAGNTCGKRSTSCADQLSCALAAAVETGRHA
ncbi:TIGR03905 family TSCPD domain-containing protein [Collinsella vaginalis]|uniref:TIGR03905 family TSCPD domain-containing protein n=1 Tax=Collinsella vaginalis TaxID=1870987 RepID=UPI000A26EBFC|nr:TIGR03905 family TSCPD domain-containing protein [Collinsella vaginalis]